MSSEQFMHFQEFTLKGLNFIIWTKSHFNSLIYRNLFNKYKLKTVFLGKSVDLPISHRHVV